jgi:hypothetical protein
MLDKRAFLRSANITNMILPHSVAKLCEGEPQPGGPVGPEQAGEYVYRAVLGKYFTFRVNKLLDLHYTLLYNYNKHRYPFFEKSLEIYKQVMEPSLDSNLFLEKIKCPISEAGGRAELASTLAEAFAEVIEHITENLFKAYGAYSEKIWPARKDSFDGAVSYIEKEFLPREGELYDRLAGSLNFEFKPPIPVFFVAEGTVHGGYTSEPSLTIININDISGIHLIETTLHEAVHGVETHNISKRPESACSLLSAELQRPKKNREFKEAWHALIFYNAGEIVRRTLDSNYIHYGEKNNIYNVAFRKQVGIYQLYWNEYLDRKITLRQAISQIANSL